MLDENVSIAYDLAMATKPKLLSEQLREAILAAGVSRIEFPKSSESAKPNCPDLYRATAGRAGNDDKIGEYLGLRLICLNAIRNPNRKENKRMASISSDRTGNRTIQFIAGDGKRCSIRLGKMSMKEREKLKPKSLRSMEQPLPALAATMNGRMVRSQKSTLYDKLAKVGLVPKRAEPEKAKLGPFIDGDPEKRTDNQAANSDRSTAGPSQPSTVFWGE